MLYALKLSKLELLHNSCGTSHPFQVVIDHDREQDVPENIERATEVSALATLVGPKSCSEHPSEPSAEVGELPGSLHVCRLWSLKGYNVGEDTSEGPASSIGRHLVRSVVEGCGGGRHTEVAHEGGQERLRPIGNVEA